MIDSSAEAPIQVVTGAGRGGDEAMVPPTHAIALVTVYWPTILKHLTRSERYPTGMNQDVQGKTEYIRGYQISR